METMAPVRLIDENVLTVDYGVSDRRFYWCFAAVESLIIQCVEQRNVSMAEIAHRALLHLGRAYISQNMSTEDVDHHAKAAMAYAIVYAQLEEPNAALLAGMTFDELDATLAHLILSLQPDQVETIKLLAGIDNPDSNFFTQTRSGAYGQFGITLSETKYERRNYPNKQSTTLTVLEVWKLLNEKKLVAIGNPVHMMLVYGYEVGATHQITLLFWEPMYRGRVRSVPANPDDAVGDILFSGALDKAPIEEIFIVPL